MTPPSAGTMPVLASQRAAEITRLALRRQGRTWGRLPDPGRFRPPPVGPAGAEQPRGLFSGSDDADAGRSTTPSRALSEASPPKASFERALPSAESAATWIAGTTVLAGDGRDSPRRLATEAQWARVLACFRRERPGLTTRNGLASSHVRGPLRALKRRVLPSGKVSSTPSATPAARPTSSGRWRWRAKRSAGEPALRDRRARVGV